MVGYNARSEIHAKLMNAALAGDIEAAGDCYNRLQEMNCPYRALNAAGNFIASIQRQIENGTFKRRVRR